MGERLLGRAALDAATYEHRVTELVRARLESAGITPSGPLILETASGSRLEDVYLAIACDEQVPGAWERFIELYRPRLLGLGIRAGSTPTDAPELVDSLLGDLCAPAPRGRARTRLGTYDGSGSLFAWLAVMLKRRLADRLRARRMLPLDGGAGASAAAHDPVDPASDPGAAAAARELSEALASGLESAWRRLTPREALVLRYKFREELPQHAIATLLGVGEPRVSRLVQAAVDKMRDGMREAVPEAFDRALAAGAAWEELRRAVELRVERLTATNDLPRGGR
jgi:RNA polymerase sigma factor (sigma-70 family)